MSATAAVNMPDVSSRRRRYHYTTALVLLERLGIDLSRVEMIAVGTNRNYRGEVISQTPPAGERLRSTTVIRLEIGCDSPVDYMPYQFFRGLLGSEIDGRGWEPRARALMAPFDATMIRYQALALSEELHFGLGQARPEQLRRRLGLFGLEFPPEMVDERSLRIWAGLMPSFNSWAGNSASVAQVLSMLFGFHFHITENTPGRVDIPPRLQTRIGQRQHRLGRECVLGESFEECDSHFEVEIFGVPARLAHEFLPGQTRRKQIDWVLNRCMPGHFDYRLIPVVSHGRLRLSDEHRHNRLGYASYL